MCSLFLLFYTITVISITRAFYMHKHKNHKPKFNNLSQLEKAMSQFLDEFRVLLEKVSVGNGTSPEDKQAIADLKQHLIDNDATDADQSTAITELVTKLGSATVPPVSTPAPTPAP